MADILIRAVFFLLMVLLGYAIKKVGILTKEEEDLYSALLTYSREEPEPKPEAEEPAEDTLTGDPVVDGLCAETFPELNEGPDISDIGTCE